MLGTRTTSGRGRSVAQPLFGALTNRVRLPWLQARVVVCLRFGRRVRWRVRQSPDQRGPRLAFTRPDQAIPRLCRSRGRAQEDNAWLEMDLLIRTGIYCVVTQALLHRQNAP